MPSIQIVFLFDLNAYTEDNLKTGLDLNRKLLCLRLTCLKILTHYYTIEPNLKWGFKFFDSHGPPTQNMCKFSFPCVTLENFEILENEISIRYQRHMSYLEALTVSVQRNEPSTSDEKVDQLDESKNKTFFPVQILQLALTQILCEFQWSNQIAMFSPSKRNHAFKHMNKNDILFLITKCPSKEENFFEYFGTEYASVTSATFAKTLLSRSLHEQLLTKSSVLWIWLSTNSESFLGDFASGILSKIAEMLRCLKCTLIPVSVYSYPPHVLEFEETQTLKMDLFNSLIPFSAIFSQSINYPFYLNKNVISRYSSLHFQGRELFISLTKIPFHWNSKELRLQRKKRVQNQEEDNSFTAEVSLAWTKFIAQFAIANKPCLQTCDMLLCFPSISSEESNFKQFQNFNKTLISKNLSLFMVCENTCGTLMPGLFSPLSDTSALISILDPKELFRSEENISFESSETIVPNSSASETLNNAGQLNMGTLFGDSCLKPFQIECLEQWFEPCSSICNLVSSCQEQKNSFPELKNFYRKFSVKLSKNQKPSPEKENIAPDEDSNEGNSSEISETIEVSGISYDELIRILTTTYELALKSGHSILQSAKKIVKSGHSFFQQKSCGSQTVEDLLKAFMNEFFSVSNRKINEKYDQSQDNEKRIQECQLQVLLALELEIIFPSSDRSNLINNVTSFLRSMSFYSSALELNKFLHDILKENYSDTLYDILVEIGEELDIPLFEEEDPYEPSEPPSSESMLGSNNSLLSSVFSVKSSSSTSSGAGNRKLIRQRSDIRDNSKSRQFLLTKSSPKKKKYKNLCPGGENIPVRYSPRLSSKRKRERNQNTQINPGHVRRNLFPKDQKLMTPKYSQSPRGRKRLRTPKAHHVLKTNFVAETPTSKQNRSALQRRKSFMDTDDSETSLTEIAESPKIVKNAKDAAHKEVLKRLNSLESLESKQFAQPERQPIPSCSSYSQYTPESKRRLSLKLFSKLLTSPTARMGLKKCSKRLFEQVSPQVENNVHYKRPKLDPGTENETSKNPVNPSQQDQKPSETN